MHELFFIITFIAMTVGFNLTHLSIDVLIQLNGGVVGFFFVYFLPAALHFKCLYLRNDSQTNIPYHKTKAMSV
jgi:hypothetical protein